MRLAQLAFALVCTGIAASAAGQHRPFEPVTDEMLVHPSPDDWLMFSRTYDAQRFSPLDQIDRSNVASLTLAWTLNLPDGVTETVPLVHDGVMYVATPGAAVEALDATTGQRLWKYQRPVTGNVGSSARTKNLAIYRDVIIYTAPDSHVVGLDARTGELRWETRTDMRGHTSGPIVVKGLAISGGACFGNRDNCYLAAHDALTGEEIWRFYTTPAPGEPGDESWSGADLAFRQASTWGFPGSYDPERDIIYWGIANPMPDHRAARHGGDADGTSRSSPADLYSNSTVALDPDTGELVWYYQHLPGDDWDLDATHERTLIRTRVAPDPAFVKWINTAVRPGEMRDVVVTLTEGGGLFAVDRNDGEFLWATPFPTDAPEFAISHVDPDGTVHINWDLVFKAPGERKTVCFWNTRSYWPTAYHPGTNSLYTSYIENCREITAADDSAPESWRVVTRPGSDPNALTGLAKIDMETGEIMRFNVGRAPSNGAVLATGGGLIFHGDMDRRFRAFDAETGERLWETILGGNVSVSTITYAVEGKQYVAVMTGDNLKVPELMGVVPEVSAPRGHNAIYVFALPDGEPAEQPFELLSFDELPDWSGVWAMIGPTVFDRATVEPQDGRAGTPGVREHPPYNDEWESKYQRNIELVAQGRFPDPQSTCGIPAGFPRIMNLPDVFEFAVRPEQTWIIAENGPNVLRIYTDGRGHPAPEDLFATYMGDSVGRWEGDTLVFETIGLLGEEGGTIVDRTGLVLSDQMRVTTRMRKVSEDVIEARMVIEDPKALVAPWHVTKEYRRMPDGTRVFDYACAENNRNPVTESGETLTLGPDGRPLDVSAEEVEQ